MSNDTKSSLINVVLLYLALALGFLGTFLKARVITPAEIGVLSSLVTIASLAGFFINLGLPTSIIKYSPELETDNGRFTGFILFNLGISFAIYVVLSGLILIFRKHFIEFFHDELLEKYFDFVLILMIGEIFNNQFRSTFQVLKKSIFSNAVYNLTTRLANLIMLCFMLAGYFNFFLFLIVDVLSVLLKSIIFMAAFSVSGKLGMPKFDFLSSTFLKKFTNYSFFMFSSGILGLAISSIDKLMIGHFVDMASVGIYRVVLTFTVLIEFIGKGFQMSNSPQIASYWRRGEIEKLKKLYSENANMQLLLSLFAFSALIAFGGDLLAILGKDYTVGFFILFFLALGELITVGTGLSGTIISFSKHYKLDFYTRIMLVVLTIATNFLFIPIWGAAGAAAATALSLLLYNTVKFVFVSWKLKMQPYDRETFSVVVLNSICASIFFLIKYLSPINNIVSIIGWSAVVFVAYFIIGINLFKIQRMRYLFDKAVERLPVLRGHK